jgi:hypothetical protein
MLPCTTTSPSLQCMSPKIADSKLDYVALVTDQEESQNPFVILDCTFPAPNRPKSPKSSPFFTERLIPSRLTSIPSFDHEKSASLIDKTWRRSLKVIPLPTREKKITNLIPGLQRRSFNHRSIHLELFRIEERRKPVY